MRSGCCAGPCARAAAAELAWPTTAPFIVRVLLRPLLATTAVGGADSNSRGFSIDEIKEANQLTAKLRLKTTSPKWWCGFCFGV